MDIEQLKLILETVGAATDSASTFAVWWLVKGAVLSVLKYLLVVGLLILVWKIALLIAQSTKDSVALQDKHNRHFKHLTRLLYTADIDNRDVIYSDVSEEAMAELVNIIRRGQSK